jgi:hypothetical protein
MGTVLQYLDQEPFRFLLSFGAILFLVLNLAAVLTMAERKASAYIQLRFGPNRVGTAGPLAAGGGLSSSCSARRTSRPTVRIVGSFSRPRSRCSSRRRSSG